MRTTTAALLLCVCNCAAAAPDDSSTGALKRLSIEELMDIEVTSVSRTPQTLSSAAAAITVLGNEDIHASREYRANLVNVMTRRAVAQL